MEKGIILTSRDAILLRSLYDNTVMSFEQIHRFHFHNKSIPTVSNRLKRLRCSGYLQSMQVGVVVHHRREKRIGIIYRVTKKTIRFLQSIHPKEKLKEDSVPFNTQSLIHDLLLNDLLLALKKRNPEKEVVHGKLIHYETSKAERVPDAVIIDPITLKKTAIELELTVKSEQRYRLIIMNYRLSGRYEAVQYFVGSEAISEKLTYLITGSKRNDRLPPAPTGVFQINRLEEVI